MRTNSPIIIGGCPRSGTSLLRSCLNSHPNIFAGPECAVGLKAVEAVIATDKNVGRRAYDAFNLTEDDILYAYGLAYDYLLSRMLKESKTGKGRIADKMPQNHRHFGMMSYMIPDAKFIHIIRDPRDVASSLYQNRHMFSYEDGTAVEFCTQANKAAEYWCHEVGLGLRMRHHENAYQCYELFYEDLAIDPESTLRSLLDWIGEDWDNNVMYPDDGGEQWTNGDTNQTPHAKSVGVYKDRLSEQYIQTIEQDAEYLMGLLGYSTSTDSGHE